MSEEQVNLLLVDDQPAKLLTYEVILNSLGEKTLTATSAEEALQMLLKHEVAVVLIDVCMPETDGFQLAAMIRDHPRFQQTAIIFISAVLLTDVDRLKGYEMGAVDYVPVPVIPEVLRAKVKVFIELYRKTRQLEQLNRELEARVAERTAELFASSERLLQSERLHSIALAAGQMGSWNWDANSGVCMWDEGQYRIFGATPETFTPTPEGIRELIHPEDRERLERALERVNQETQTLQAEFRIRRPNGETRWCIGAAAADFDDANRVVRLSGVTVDITTRKEAEERQALLAREVDHRARNTLAIVQSIIRLTRVKSLDAYIAAVEGRIKALSIAHELLAESRWEGADVARLVREELAPYQMNDTSRVTVTGPTVLLQPIKAQTLALALHELATNAAKYGALSSLPGRVTVSWVIDADDFVLEWIEIDGPPVRPPSRQGYGTQVIKAGIENQLGGRTRFDWHKKGLRCTFSIPHSPPIGQPYAAPIESARTKRQASFPVAAGDRILIVEDEALVAMMIAEIVSDFGFVVVGPFGRIADALASIGSCEIDAAVLDVNVNGESIHSLAEALADQGIPFAFITGYSTDAIDQRFSKVPVIQKPIEQERLRAVLLGPTRYPTQATSIIGLARQARG